MSWINQIYRNAAVFSAKSKNQRFFAIGLVVIMAGLAYLFWEVSDPIKWWGTPVLVFSLVSTIWPKLIETPLRVWMILTMIIGEVVSTVILFIIFFLLFAPLSLLSGKRKNPGGWQEADSKIDYEKMY